jgi:dihydrofolate synthase/folylpolyglutamate synthase
MAALTIDVGDARIIHVAGTNGKGSVCAMIDAIYRAAKYRTGLFTSPHLVTFRERIRVNGEMVPEEGVADGLTNIRDLVSTWDPHPTFFEVTTALALKYFAGRNVDICILETGLGGRLDATNAVQADVAVITPIDLDHQKWLGDSLRQIATEKAGIIKLNTRVVSAPQLAEAEEVIRKRAAECEAPLQIVTESYEASPVALRGAHQKQNAAVAIAAIRAAKACPERSRRIAIDDAAIVLGLASVEWPARFQRWDERLILDGAHNPAAARVLAQTWRENFPGQRATLVLAILNDKDLRAVCEALAPIVDFVLLPKIRSERAADPNDLAKVLSEIFGKRQSGSDLPYSISSSVADALKQARARPSPILLTGSLHFAGEALAYLRGEPAAFEECAQ